MHRTSSSEIKHAVLLSAREREPGRRRAISAEENKALVRREQQELWNHTGELHAADEFFAADQAELPRAPASTFFRRDFPDVLSTIEDIIAEGDTRWLLASGAEPPGGVYGHSCQRQGGATHGHLHLPHRGGQDRPGVECGG